MRIDDRIDTILAWTTSSDADRARVWRQLADLLSSATAPKAGTAQVLRRMRECEDAVGRDERHRFGEDRAAREIGERAHAERLIQAVEMPTAEAETASGNSSQIVGLLARLDAFHANRADSMPAYAADAVEMPLQPTIQEPAVALPVARVNGDGLGQTIGLLRGPLHRVPHLLVPDALPTGELRAAAALVADRSVALADALDALELAVAMAGDAGLDSGALLARLDAALQPLAETRGLRISFRVASGLPAVDADALAVERMVTRLVGAIVSLARRGEHVVARMGRDRANRGMMALSITRPGRLLGRDERALFDPPPRPDQADAPELGLSFALRLIDRLARETGGLLTVHDDRIVLALPLRSDPPCRAVPAR